MRKVHYLLLLFVAAMWVTACKDDEDPTAGLRDEIEDLKEVIDSIGYQRYRDSLQFVLDMKELDYRQFVDSLRRADSLAANGGQTLPFTYTVLVFDGSNTSVSGGNMGGEMNSSEARVSGFETEVTVKITQFGVTQTVTTTDGLAKFESVGRGIINGSITAEGYTTLEWSAETLIRPNGDLIDDEDYMDYVLNSSLGHTFAIFALDGETSATILGRATVETDLTNADPELAPEGTTFLASIDVENDNFKQQYVWNGNKQLFVDNIYSFGYSPVFRSQIDAAGDYAFTLPGSPSGLPMRLEYSDFIANRTIFIQNNGDVTQETKSTAYGPTQSATALPSITMAPTVVFEAGGGAAATAQVSGTGTVTAINLVNGGQNFQGTPRVIISAPSTAGGTRATATATVTNGVVTGITLTDGGSGYTSEPTITITEGFGAEALVTNLYPLDIDNGNTVGGGVGAVQLVNAGIYWNGTAAVAPFVLFNGVREGSGNGVPDVTVNMNAQGNIASVTVNNPGYGYENAPSVTFTAGTGATAQVTDVDDATGAIIGVSITSPGQNYPAVRDIIVNSAEGEGAVLTVQIQGAANNFGLTNLQITNGGTDYEVGDVITFQTIQVSGASASAVWEGLSIESYQITAGYGGSMAAEYVNTPLVVFDEPDYTGATARRAQGTAVITNGRLTGINITDHGRGYYNAPAIRILSGSGASAQTEFDEMKISGFNITNQGAGYLEAPDIVIVDGTGAGSGATATASLTDGRVTEITLTNAGSGYINSGSILVFFLDPGHTFDAVNNELIDNPAEGTVVVVDGEITAVNVTSGGDNYKAARVLIESTKGSGFAGTVTVAGGRVADVVVTAGGVGYVNGNNPSTAQSFGGNNNITTFSGVTRVLDVHYGTGRVR